MNANKHRADVEQRSSN